MMLRILLISALATVGLAFSPHSSAAFHHRPSTSLKMVAEVKEGDTLPSVVLKEGQADYASPKDVNLGDLIKGKKVAIFAVPGAFTPGCSKSHLPSFITAQEELKAKGLGPHKWWKLGAAQVVEVTSDAGIKFLSDANAELSRALGLAIEGDVMVRTKRFSLIADDGVVTHYFSSANESSDTWAPNVLAKL
ncbi:hypothetical protein ACHAXN_000814 [Cyclotella atomus]